MNNYLKLKIFIFCLIGFISSQTAFSYTFFVETSQFNDDVYVIENVVSDKKNQSIDLNTGSDLQDKDNVVPNTNNISKRDKDDNFIREYNIEALIGLSWSPAWAINHDGGDDQAIAEYKFWVNGSFAAMAGYPHVTIPFDYVDKLPIGMSFIGSKWDDKKLIELAYAAEQLIQFKPTPNI